MQEHLKKRAQHMVEILEVDRNSGFMPVAGKLVLRSAGGLLSDSPTPYNENDLQNAVDLGLLEKRGATLTNASGENAWEWYTVK